jgi:hypothetical protein
VISGALLFVSRALCIAGTEDSVLGCDEVEIGIGAVPHTTDRIGQSDGLQLLEVVVNGPCGYPENRSDFGGARIFKSFVDSAWTFAECLPASRV